VIDKALAALRDGKFILLYDFDDREGETDFAIRSDAVTPKDIVRMRKDGGGLICTAVHPVAARRLGLPFASDALRAMAVAERQGDIPYDRKNHSSFSLWVNHRNTFTGITDRDRALTVNAIAEHVKHALNGGNMNFHEAFRTPGHIALLRAADGLLDVRRGQTELSIAMAEMAKINPAVTICEMLDDESGYALTKADAKIYAKQHGLVFVEGPEVLEQWEKNKKSSSF
jgi:3,4-dihydroxy 2-butanone 4-phosphate synthase